ncbi:hypothetical protein M422DRAFT_198290 [Sphaerobolus stellatus SS14]|nr:hypothetical protein M422DRAFT_198290 [Sphaerobolus stellatus SS14]
MDPSKPYSFNHRAAELSTGRTYHFIDQIPEKYSPNSTPTLLCVHGFPDLWYGWRYCIGPWVQTYGYRVIVPDMLGYGGTDKPVDPANYSTKALSDDLAALLDIAGVKKAIVLGHDWGCATTWRFALWHPERVRALVGLSIPFVPPAKEYISIEQVAQRQPRFSYQLFFNDSSSTKQIEGKLREFLSGIFAAPSNTNNVPLLERFTSIAQGGNTDPIESLINTTDFQYYFRNFKAGGMNGPLNYYRTTKHRFEEELGALPDHLPASLPVLFLWGDSDPTCPPNQVKSMRKFISSLKVVSLSGKGHWLMLEAPGDVVRNVGDFVHGLVSKESPKL